MMHYQVAIIGGGPGGYETAIRLKQLNISVICLEKERLGGVCLHKGCIPTKSLVNIANLYYEFQQAEQYGLENYTFPLNFMKISPKIKENIEKLALGIEFIFHKHAITYEKIKITKIQKKGYYHLFAEQTEYCTAEFVIIATGSEPKTLSALPIDGKKILTSDHIIALPQLPSSLAIVGGGVIGCEFACLFQKLGADVTIIEFLPEIIPTEDDEIAKKLIQAMRKLGVKILTKTKVESVKHIESGMGMAPQSTQQVELELSNGKTLITDYVLVAVGRKPIFDIETEGFYLNQQNEYLVIDDYCCTNEKKIFAIGDVTGKLMLAHSASKQGLFVAEMINDIINNIPSHIRPIIFQNIPRCIFTSPEVASCGLTEKQAREQYHEVNIGKFPYQANGKAVCSGNTFGLVKTIFNAQTNVIVGMHIIGYLATELIAQASILINTGSTINDLANIVFAHPTLSECIMESAEDAYNKAIHVI